MRTFSYAWSLPVMWQRWQSHHSIHHSWKPHAACKRHGCMFYRAGVIADGSFALQEYGFSTFTAPVILTLTRWPSYMNLTCIPRRYTRCAKMNSYVKAFESYPIMPLVTHGHFWSHHWTCIPWRYTGCASMNFIGQGFWKFSSDRQTDTTEIFVYHTALWVVSDWY